MSNVHWSHSVHHDGSPCYVTPQNPYSFGSTITLKLRTGLNTPIERVFVRTNPDGEQHMIPMQPGNEDAVARWWEADIPLKMVRNNYRFYILTTEGGWWLTAAGMVRYTPPDATDFKILAQYHAPTWVHDSVFYQIFPDRFADGDPDNNVYDNEYLCYGKHVAARPWGELPGHLWSQEQLNSLAVICGESSSIWITWRISV